MAKTTLTFSSKELMQIVYDHVRKNKLLPDGTYDGRCLVRPTGTMFKQDFEFVFDLQKVD